MTSCSEKRSKPARRGRPAPWLTSAAKCLRRSVRAMTAEQNLDSALAGIELQFGRLSKSKEQRREDELIAERMD